MTVPTLDLAVVEETLIERHGWTEAVLVPWGTLHLHTPNGNRAWVVESDGLFTLFFERADSDVTETLTGSTSIPTQCVINLFLRFDSGEIHSEHKGDS